MMTRHALAAPAAALAVLVLAASCATAPTPGGSGGGAPTELPRMVCGQGSRIVDLRRTGVPSDSELLDVALDGDRIWVLAESRFLVELPREVGGTARFLHGRDDTPPWSALAADPAGGLWIVSRTSFDLLHFDPATGRTRRVTVERASGPGGFNDVALGDGVVYVTPTCSDHGVWTIDPADGRLLDRAFSVEEMEADDPMPSGAASDATSDAEEDGPGCSLASLAHGPGGAVYASWNGAVHRVGGDGWVEVPALAPTGGMTALRGLDVGERTETWFFENTRGFLFVDGAPVWVGGGAMSAARDRHGVLLFRRGADGALIPHLEPCLGAFALAFDSDDAGYVFLTADGLVSGPVEPPPAAGSP